MMSSKELSPHTVQQRDANEILAISNLYKSFGENHVLNGFNITLRKGENVVVLGKSGCGKSVLIKCIAGLLKYDQGSIQVFGKEIMDLKHAELDKMRSRIGFVFQSSALYDSMTVKENLMFPLQRHSKHQEIKEMELLIEEMLFNVGLPHTMDMMPAELSGGMRKRIGLARALILKPELMLYDEPTTGLDPITADEISNLMLDMQQKYNTSSIIISHDMYCAKLTANRLAVLVDGVNYIEGTFDEVRRCTDDKVRPFFKNLNYE